MLDFLKSKPFLRKKAIRQDSFKIKIANKKKLKKNKFNGITIKNK